MQRDASKSEDRMVVVVNTASEKAIAEWRESLAEMAPHLEVRWWDDANLDPTDVRYAVVWKLEHGRLAHFTGLKVLFSLGAGVDNIVADPAWPRHVPLVRMVPAEGPQRMGEYVTWAALSLQKDLPCIFRSREAKNWDSFATPTPTTECTVGIMGLGAMGRRSADLLRGVGFPVIGWSRSRKALPFENFAGAEELDAFLARSRILVCLLPATPETTGILSAPLLVKLPRGAGLINAGRGAHQNLADIIAALDEGHLTGAVLDVFDPEPLPADSPAWIHPKVIVTSHIGAGPSTRECARYVATSISAFELREALYNLYDPTRGY